MTVPNFQEELFFEIIAERACENALKRLYLPKRRNLIKMSDFCKKTADTFCRLYDRAANINYKRTVYFIAYTAMFAAAMVCVYLSYVQNGKFIAGGSDSADALTQQLTFFRYWGEYIRDFFSNVAEGHPELPFGLGA